MAAAAPWWWTRETGGAGGGGPRARPWGGHEGHPSTVGTEQTAQDSSSVPADSPDGDLRRGADAPSKGQTVAAAASTDDGVLPLPILSHPRPTPRPSAKQFSQRVAWTPPVREPQSSTGASKGRGRDAGGRGSMARVNRARAPRGAPPARARSRPPPRRRAPSRAARARACPRAHRRRRLPVTLQSFVSGGGGGGGAAAARSSWAWAKVGRRSNARCVFCRFGRS